MINYKMACTFHKNEAKFDKTRQPWIQYLCTDAQGLAWQGPVCHQLSLLLYIFSLFFLLSFWFTFCIDQILGTLVIWFVTT